jgi:hypothetical protein
MVFAGTGIDIWSGDGWEYLLFVCLFVFEAIALPILPGSGVDGWLRATTFL